MNNFPRTPIGNGFFWHAPHAVYGLMPPPSLDATLWEVPVHLRGRQVQLRYEPFEWSVVEVWHGDTFAGLARRCDKHLNAKTYGSADYER